MENQPGHNCNNLNQSEQEYDLDKRFLELLDKDSPLARTLWVSVRNNLRQFNLTGSYTEACVISEAYIRAVKVYEKGEKIDNLLAWCRKTAYNYVRELSRIHRKLQPIDEIIESRLAAKPEPIADEVIDDDLIAIRKAYEMLSPDDKNILNLSVVEELPWKTIKQMLVQDGAKNRNEAALRKAKERALKRLRENYHSVGGKATV
jgi:RNA polymerase sigma factor (sigma-70 family)